MAAHTKTEAARVAATLLLSFALAMLSLLAPAHVLPAHAANAPALTFSSVSIDAKASTDGSLQVLERRTLEAQGEIGSLVWVFDDLSEDAEFDIVGVRMAPIDAEGNLAGEWTKLPELAFALDWRGGSNRPRADGFSFDSPMSTLYVFSSWSDTRAIVEIEYAVAAGIQVYDDMAQIEWRYVSETWPVDAQNLSLTIALPMPSGVMAVSGKNVFAWGHGPAEGELSVGSDGVVSYSVPRLAAGQFAEARVLFPQSWLSNLSPLAQAARLDGNIRDSAVSQEEGWTDQGNFWRRWDVGVVSTSAGVSALALLLAALVFWTQGKPRRPAVAHGAASGVVRGESDGFDAACDEQPASGVGCEGAAALEAPEPAVAGRLLRWNEPHVHDITATVISLVRRGFVSVAHSETGAAEGIDEDAAGSANERAVGSSDEATAFLRLVLDDEKAATLSSKIDIASLELLFNELGEGRRVFALGEIRTYALAKPAAFVRLIDGWQRCLSEEVARQGLFDAKSLRARKLLAAEAVLALGAGLAITAALGNPIPIAFALPVSLLIAVMAHYVPRRSAEAAALLERYERQMANGSLREKEGARLPQSDELARLADELDGLLDYSYAKAQTVAAQQRVAASRQGSFGGTYKA